MAVSFRPRLVQAGLFSIALSSCGNASSGGAAGAPSGDTRQVFTGGVADTDARVAFVMIGNRAQAYVCGGPTTFATASHWFDLGTGANANAAYSATTAGHTLTATFDGTAFSGTLLMPDGTSHVISTQPKVAGTETDLFGAVDEGCRTGAILEQRGTEEPTLQGTWCSSGGGVYQVTPAHPIRVVNQVLNVSVSMPAGDRPLALTPVTSFE